MPPEAGACAVEVLPDATAEDIVRAFQAPRLRGRIAVLHFTGHADPSALLLETLGGGVAAVAGQSLAAFLGTQPELALVFLNGCKSLDLAKRLLPHGVGAVIGSTEELDDAWAADFATVFYRALAGGCTLAQAFQEAKTAPRGQAVPDVVGGGKRSIGGILDDSPPPEPPWQLETRPGQEHLRDWRLQDSDPLRHLPLPKDSVLPTEPFHLGLLQGYDRPHAPAFFGRRAIIRQLYDQLTGDETKPIVLFYGQSGVGKSSVLAAGLLPRLGACYSEPAHLRRPPQTGLLAALIGEIGPGATLAEAWRTRETRDGKPLLIVLDQVEELLQNPPAGPAEWQALLAALENLFQTPEQWPQGKLLLGLRKEWEPEVAQDLLDRRLPFERMKLLKRLDKDDIRDIFRGATREYDLRLTPENLPERIAADLLADPDSPVAPTLQILLSQLWQDATRDDIHTPKFAEAQYEQLRRQGLHLEDFLDRKLAELKREHPAWSRSGLALDVLNEHTTDLDFAAERSEPALQQRFPRQAQELPKVLAYFKDRFLLAEAARQGRDAGRATRLVHDTLAPLVRRKWRERKQREELRWEKRRTLIARAAAGVLLAAVGWGLWWWDANYREQVEYFAHYEKRFGFPEGIGLLSREQMLHRKETFQLVRHGRNNPVEEMRIVNGSGFCPQQNSEHMLIGAIDEVDGGSRQICIYHFERGRAGKIDRESAYDASENKLYELLYTSKKTAKYNIQGYDKAQANSGASYVAFERTKNGWDRQQFFTNGMGMPRPNNSGCYGLLRDFDERGLARKVVCLNREGKPKRNDAGYATMVHRYDSQGNITETEYFNELDRPKQHPNGFSKATQSHDKWGNLIEQDYFDEQGLSTLSKNGYAKTIMRYDASGNEIETSVFDGDGKPIINKFGWAKINRLYDERGNVTEHALFDERGQPTRNESGWARLALQYDKQGNVIEEAYFDEQGKPVKDMSGYAKWIGQYDEKGHRIETTYFDERGQLARSQEGYAKITQRYDERGNLIEQA